MKTRSWLIVTAALMVGSCTKLGFDVVPNDYNGDGVADTFTITLADHTQKVVCNSTTWQLNAGNTFQNAGFVNVSNDAANLYITVNSTFGFQPVSENIKVWVGTSLDLLPVNGPGTPIPGQFPFKATVPDGVNEYSFTISWAQIEAYNPPVSCLSKFYVYVHGDVYTNADKKTETAWGGDTCVTSQDSNTRWVCSGIYQAKCCNTTPPPPSGTSQTAFAKGGYVFTSDKKSNPEKLPSINLTRNRWGWAINLKEPGQSTYEIWAGAGLNYTSKGTLVGTLNVTWDGTNVTVTYNMATGFLLDVAHVYAGDFMPTTVAPGQYGNTTLFDPRAATFTQSYPVIDSNGDGVWIIAHASVYGNF